MKRTAATLGASIICLACLPVWTEAKRPAYVPRGPDETAAFEVAMEKRLPVYRLAFVPRAEFRHKGVTESEIPARIRDQITQWIRDTLDKRYQPDAWDQVQMTGLSDYVRGRGYVYCTYDVEVQRRVAQIHILASGAGMGITMVRQAIGTDDAASLSDHDVWARLRAVLALPPEALDALELERRGEVVEDVPVSYGRAIARDGSLEPMEFRWWQAVSYWIGRNRIFVNVYPSDVERPRCAPWPDWEF